MHFNNVSYERVDDALSVPSTIFFDLFPFHLLIARTMKITKAGRGIIYAIPDILNQKLNEAFLLICPVISFTWEALNLQNAPDRDAGTKIPLLIVDEVFFDQVLFSHLARHDILNRRAAHSACFHLQILRKLFEFTDQERGTEEFTESAVNVQSSERFAYLTKDEKAAASTFSNLVSLQHRNLASLSDRYYN
ncbi:unnamed protein product [Schistocephalus solidus]|uniref:guanylate cyclase n=1 Tax=Schistocephalus solidus TaxID=70667 RepID=A0A3P7D1B2_SCHSO|nr:unnamed protein product [Schistocephalus solidus]